MKKLLLTAVMILLLFASWPLTGLKADTDYYENEYPYRTYTVDYEGHLTFTQTAYTPLGVLNRNVQLSDPEDIYIKDGLVYVADSGNSRIAVLNYRGELEREIGTGTLDNPTGVFVSLDDYLYVADKGNELVYKFDLEGDLIRTYGRPSEPLFGTESLYVPIKVVVGSGENIYVIGDGSTSGVIQMNYDGSFLGYFGVNLSAKSLVQKIADIFVQPGAYARNIPPSPTNITINSKSLVYTSTPNAVTALKKLDVNGNNILTATNYDVEASVVDLSVNDSGYLYAIYDDGFVVEYDESGNLLFAFDIMSGSSNTLGLIQSPSSIQIDELGNLFVADNTADQIVVFQPSSFADLVHQAIDLYNAGNYAQSTLMFENILEQNSNFALAHSALGKAYYQDEDFQAALNEYRLANDTKGYSETFWKIRDNWLNNNLTWVFISLIGLIALVQAVKLVNKKTVVFAAINQRIGKVKANREFRKFSLVTKVCRHPIDSYYEIKRQKRSDIRTSIIILVVLFVEYLLLQKYTGFVFNTYPDRINLGFEIVKFFGLFGLFVFSNYLIATLFDGEGWLKDVFIASSYALSPLVIGLVPLILLSNFLTLNEKVIFDIYVFIMIAWTGILVFLAIKEIHNYEIKETIKNLLMTAFTMLIIILILFIIYVFGSQLVNFILSWLKEVANRVFG